MSGKTIAKGPKIEKLFPLHFSIPTVSLGCMTINSQSEI